MIMVPIYFRKYRLFFFVLIGVTVLWAVYLSVGQMLIRQMYEGTSLWFLNNVIRGQNVHSVDYFLHLLDSALIKISILLLSIPIFSFLIKRISKNKIIRYSIYFLVVIFVLHLFMLKWGFLEDGKGHSLESMLNYNADRPWAYRVLTPMIINSISRPFIENKILFNRSWLTEESPIVRYYVKNKESLSAELSFKFHVIYLYLLISLFLLLLLVRYLTKINYHFPPLVSDSAPFIGLLFLPLTFLHSGYFYDFPELLFMAAYLILIIKQKWIFLYAVYFLAVLNKESNVLLVLFLMAFYKKKILSKDFFKHLIIHISIGTLLIILIRNIFIVSEGLPIFNHLEANLKFWATPKNYFLFFDPYYLGLKIFPRGGNILLIVFISCLIFYKWKEKPPTFRKLLAYTFLVNLPLFIIGGNKDEIRNLSLIFPAIYFLGVHSIYNFVLFYRNKRKNKVFAETNKTITRVMKPTFKGGC